jgi:integrase
VNPATLRSAMASTLQMFLKLRQSLGYGDRGARSLIAHFDRYLVARDWKAPLLTRALVEDWAASGGPLQPRSRAKRLHVMRLLGRFLAQTHPETYIPGPAWGPRQESGFRPHIYTHAQILALLDGAARLTPTGSLRPHTFVTLLGLLYCSGLRISEALALRLVDVDAADATIWVRESKFHKSRGVPLSAEVVEVLERYRTERTSRGHAQDPEAPFFINEHGHRCAYPTVVATFLVIARQCGLRGPPGTKGPRIHDLRHAFAVHRLLAWYRDGGDVQARLPLLADYLGHVSIVSTQVYLEITAELLDEAAHRFLPPKVPVRTSLGESR